MPLLKKKTVVGASIETTESIAQTGLGVSDVIMLAQDVTYAPEFTTIERNIIGPSLAKKVPRVTTKLARITFKIEVVGSGTLDVAPKWGPLLNACGFSTTTNASTDVTYDPVTPTAVTYHNGVGDSTGNTALTLWVFLDGKARKAKHCRGTVRFVGEAANLCFMEFDFLGVYQEPVDVAFPGIAAANYDTNTPPLVESAAFAFQDVTAGSAIVRNFTVDMGVSVIARFDVSSADGFKGVLINDRNATATIDPEEELVGATGWGSKDAYKRFADAESGTFSIKIGTAAGNTLTISAPAAKAQITDVGEGDRDGIATNEITLGFFQPDEETTTEVRVVHT